MAYHAILEPPNYSDPWQTPQSDPPSGDQDAPADLAGPPPEPARPRPVRTAIAWLLIAICTIAIMWMQAKASKTPPPLPADASPGLDMVFFGRLAVGFEQVVGQSDPSLLMNLDGQAMMSPFSTTDRMRVAIIAAELQGKEQAIERLSYLSDENLSSKLETASAFTADHRMLTHIYSEDAYIPTDSEAQGLIARHGWFGELAAGYNLPNNDPLHQSPRDDASRIVWLIFGFGGALCTRVPPRLRLDDHCHHSRGNGQAPRKI